MVATAAPVAQVTDLATLPPTAQAAALGLPANLFGFTPSQSDYWREPGLPWLTAELWENSPLGRNGFKLIWDLADVQGQAMAPRFPHGSRVNVARVSERAHLQVGKVYLYVYRNAQTGAEECQLGRLAHIGGNYLKVTFDNDPTPALWLLNPRPSDELGDVHEVTHYASYPVE